MKYTKHYSETSFRRSITCDSETLIKTEKSSYGSSSNCHETQLTREEMQICINDFYLAAFKNMDYEIRKIQKHYLKEIKEIENFKKELEKRVDK